MYIYIYIQYIYTSLAPGQADANTSTCTMISPAEVSICSDKDTKLSQAKMCMEARLERGRADNKVKVCNDASEAAKLQASIADAKLFLGESGDW